jgi:hypothetical protein
MLSPHHRNDVKNAFRHQKRQRSYQFRHVNMLNIPNVLYRRARPIAGAQAIHQMYLPCGQTSARSLPTILVRLEVHCVAYEINVRLATTSNNKFKSFASLTWTG